VLHRIAPQRKGLPVTAYRLGAVFTLAVAIAFSAQAQIILHGNDIPAGEATPTNGSFSIGFPVSYKDVEQTSKPDAVASDIRHEKWDDPEILSFSLSEPKQEYLFRVMRSKTTGYVLTVQCPPNCAARRSK
jgi:hypothetical protein